MKKFIVLLFTILNIACVWAQNGQSCENAIRITPGATYDVQTSELWFTAGTRDLPISINIFPKSGKWDGEPSALVDFKCDSQAEYDSISQKVVDKAKGYGIKLPRPVGSFTPKTLEDGTQYYSMFIGKDLAKALGIAGVDSTLNLLAYVKLSSSFQSYSTISPDSLGDVLVTPDTAVTCANRQFYELPNNKYDTLSACQKFYKIRLADCTNGIYAMWETSTGRPMTISFSLNCDFVSGDYTLLTYSILDGQNVLLADAAMVQAAVAYYGATEGYVRIGTTGDGYLRFNSQPITPTPPEILNPCLTSGILTTFPDSEFIKANDESTIYRIPVDAWKNKNIKLSWDGRAMTAVFAKSCDFTLSADDPQVVGIFDFTKDPHSSSAMQCGLMYGQVNAMCQAAKDKYLYMRLMNHIEDGMLTVGEWNPDCLDKSTELVFPGSNDIPANSSSTVYRIKVDNVVDKHVRFKWNGSENAEVYLACACEFNATDSDMYVLKHLSLTLLDDTAEIKSTEMNEFVKKVDENGCLYLSVINEGKGTLNISTMSASPCVNIPNIGFPDTVLIDATNHNAVYRIHPSDWEGNKVRITWKGHDDLKVHFALDCDPAASLSTRTLSKDSLIMTFTKKYVNNLAALAEDEGATEIYLHFEGSETANLIFDTWKGACAEGSVEAKVGEPLKIEANDTTTTYGLPVSHWSKKNVILTWSGLQPLEAYMADTCEYTMNLLDDRLLDLWEIDGSMLIPVVKVVDLVDVSDEDGYIYLRMNTKESGTLTVTLQTPTCLDKSAEIAVPGSVKVNANRSSLSYKISADAVQNDDIRFTWDGTTKLTMYVGDTCEFNLSANNRHVLKPAPYVFTSSRNTVTIEYETWQSWLSKADEGYVYLRFVTESEGIMKTEIAASHETKTCVEKSALLPLPATDMDITNNVVYRLDAAAWAANNVRITWSGATAATMTVADNCDMRNTIWSQAFVRSTAASGVHSVDLTKETIARWTPAADGFLYAKFSNITPGKVTVETYTIDVPKTCLERSTHVPFGTKTAIKSGELYRIEPASWKFDQLRAVWTGSTALTLELKYDCDATAKQSTHTVRDTLTGIESLAKATAPLYFVANAAGDLTFESYTAVAEPTCEERAQVVSLSVPARLIVGQTYKISTQGWADRNIRIVWNGNAAALEFSAACDDAAARVLNVTDTLTQVEALASLGQLLYFTTSAVGTILFEEWEPVVITPCEDIATIINLPDALTIPAGGDQVWMFNAEAWKTNNVDFSWVCNAFLTAYINPSCYDEADDDTSMALIEFDANETITLTSAEITKIAAVVDTYAYVRFGGNKLPGKLRITIHQISAVDGVIAGINDDTMVEVYTVAGQRIYSGTYGNMSLTRGIYLIHTADQTLKVVK